MKNRPNNVLMRVNHISGIDIEVRIGNIAEQECDAIVNAANIYLQNGSGVCGAIFDGAGSQLKDACNEQLHLLGRNLQPSEAIKTEGFNLKARFIIHSVSPRCMFRWDQKIEELMRMTYHNIFELANQSNLKTIAIPAMAVGHHHCDPKKCTSIAMSELFNYLKSVDQEIEEIRFVLFDIKMAELYVDMLCEYLILDRKNREKSQSDGGK